MKVNISLREETNAEFEERRAKLNMTKEQFLRQLLAGEDIRPVSIFEEYAIERIADLERDLKVLCMKEELSDVEKLQVFEILENVRKEVKVACGQIVLSKEV